MPSSLLEASLTGELQRLPSTAYGGSLVTVCQRLVHTNAYWTAHWWCCKCRLCFLAAYLVWHHFDCLINSATKHWRACCFHITRCQSPKNAHAHPASTRLPARAVHRVRPPPRDPLLTALFGSLAQLPPVPSLQYTAALMVGSYSGWLDASLQQGMELATVLELLQMLVTGFGHNDTAPAATLALCNVCEACAGPLTAAMPMLGGLYQQVVVGGEGMLLQEQEVQQVQNENKGDTCVDQNDNSIAMVVQG